MMTLAAADLFIERDAVISHCGKYRYLLRRSWDHTKPRALLVMLNPSTADANIDDATVRSCARLLRALHYGSFEIVNLFGFRATNPNDLGQTDDAVGPDNDGIAVAAVNRCDIAICAWGAHWSSGGRGRRLHEIITAVRPVAYCFGRTKSGAPKHPLYIKTGTPLEVYP